MHEYRFIKSFACGDPTAEGTGERAVLVVEIRQGRRRLRWYTHLIAEVDRALFHAFFFAVR